ISYENWRPSDQKVYISDISKVKEKLRWNPRVGPREGVNKLVGWIKVNEKIFM
ncbi:MAG: CDP-paratose 2-epimerase, partial [Thermotogae bacterium]